MTAITTNKLKQSIAEAIYDDIFSRRNNYYYYIGKAIDWEGSEATPLNTLDYETFVRSNIIAAKRIYGSDVAFVVPRFDWISGNSYVKYSTTFTGTVDPNTGPKFYVYESLNSRVYKCIQNGTGVSTDRPVSTLAEDVTYADGYTWRYLYTIPKSLRNKFLSSTYMPVFTALQKRYYSDGGVGELTIVKSGSGYVQGTTAILVVGDGTGAVMEPVITGGKLADIIVRNPGRDYTRAKVIISSPAGTGAEVEVDLSTGDLSSDQALVELLTVPGTIDSVDVLDGGAGYLTATVTILGDGTGATATATITSGVITAINVTNKGRNYTQATVVITGQTVPNPPSVLATTRVNVSPFLGHGRSAVSELFANSLMFYGNIFSDRLADFDVANDYRQFGIIKNIRNLDYSPNVYDQVSTNRYQVTADFGPIITFVGGSGSGTKGRVNVTGKYVSEIKVKTPGENYTSPPSVGFTGGNQITVTNASGTGSVATLTYATRSVAPFAVGSTITVAGMTPSGYNGTYTVTACTTTTVQYASATTGFTSGGTVSGVSATGIATIVGTLDSSAVTITFGGVGYVSPPGGFVESTTGSGGKLQASVTQGVGGFTITDQGTGYDTPPAIGFTGGGGGSGAAATAYISEGKVTKIVVTNPGSGYTSAPWVTFTGGTPATTAVATSTLSYTMSSLTVSSVGEGYETNPGISFSGASGISDVEIIDSGELFTANPTVTFSGGGGSGAAATAVKSGCVRSILVTNGGSGYTTVPGVTFTGGTPDHDATATAVLSAGKVVEIIITDRGSGYDSAPTIGFTGGGGGSGAAATATYAQGIKHINITNPGMGYTSPPIVTLSNDGTRRGHVLLAKLGSATATVGIKGSVKSVAVTNSGTSYETAPTIALTGGAGTGATAVAKVVGGVTSITIDEGGSGYSTAPDIIISGGEGSGATGKAVLSGNSVASVTITNPGNNYVLTKFSSFTVGDILVDKLGNEYQIYAAMTNKGTGSLILTSNTGSVISGNMELTKQSTTDYFMTTNALSQTLVESRFPVACYKVRGAMDINNYPADTVLVATDQTNGNKYFVVISSKINSGSESELLLAPINGGKISNGITLARKIDSLYPFSVVSYDKPAIDVRTGELMTINNEATAFTQNSDQTLSFRTVLNF